MDNPKTTTTTTMTLATAQAALAEAEARLQRAHERAEYHNWNGSSSRAYTEARAAVKAARRQVRAATPRHQHAIFSIFHYGRGLQLAKRDLHDLEAKLARASAADWDALRPATDMYRAGQLTLAGYALLLWERLEAHNADVYAYHEHISHTPVVWDGLQRLELVQWNVIAADRWTQWATHGGTAGGTTGDEAAQEG